MHADTDTFATTVQVYMHPYVAVDIHLYARTLVHVGCLYKRAIVAFVSRWLFIFLSDLIGLLLRRSHGAVPRHLAGRDSRERSKRVRHGRHGLCTGLGHQARYAGLGAAVGRSHIASGPTWLLW
jgi:hypothetical protein